MMAALGESLACSVRGIVNDAASAHRQRIVIPPSFQRQEADHEPRRAVRARKRHIFERQWALGRYSGNQWMLIFQRPEIISPKFHPPQ
jgi:hypothetical protein